MSVEASPDFSAAVPDSSFGPLQQIDAGVLNVGYVDAGPAEGPVVVLLHGWPYDIHSYVDVAPLLAARGLPGDRSVPARLRHDAVPVRRRRSATASRRCWRSTSIALMDALEIERRSSAGFDWGARTADIVAALWPERCTGLVVGERLLIGNREANQQPLPPEAELQWWYQYYFATERGRLGYSENRHEFTKLIWRDRLAEVGLRRRHVRPHRGVLRQPRSRRHRHPQLPLAAGPGRRRAAVRRPGSAARRTSRDHRADDHHRQRLRRRAADGRAYAEKFSGAYSHRILEGIGHNVPQEAPGAFTDAILEVGGGLP